MAVLFPLVPNWVSGLRERLEFKSDLMASRDDAEQRRAIRDQPRASWEFSVLADAERRQAYEQFMQTHLGEDVLLPDYSLSVRTTSGIPVGGNTVAVESVPTWLVPGAKFAIQSRRTVALVEVDSITGLNVVLTEAVTQGWPVPSRLRPVMSGIIDGGNANSLHTATVLTGSIAFDVDPGSQTLAVGAPGSTLGGFEVFPAWPNWATSPQIGFSRTVDKVDYGQGRVKTYRPVPRVTRTQQGTFLRKTAVEVRSLKQFFLRQKGRRGQFYMPSWTSDMELVSLTAGGAGLVVQGTAIYNAYRLSDVHKAVWLRLADNTFRAYQVSAITLSGGNSVLNIGAVGETIAPYQVRMLSWLYQSRFTNDAMTIDWLTDEVANIQLQTQTLRAA